MGSQTNIWGKIVLGRGSSKCRVVTSGRSMVLLKTESQQEWLTYSEWVRWGMVRHEARKIDRS